MAKSIAWVTALGLLAAIARPEGVAMADSGFFVQIASVKSEARARAAWADLQRTHPILLGDLALDLEKADLGARGTFYRVRTGPFPNKATAEDMCRQIEAAKLDCVVVGG